MLRISWAYMPDTAESAVASLVKTVAPSTRSDGVSTSTSLLQEESSIVRMKKYIVSGFIVII